MTLGSRPIKTIGVMSGTSLDGLDIIACEFSKANKVWDYTIYDATTLKYSDGFKKQLSSAPQLSGFELAQLNIQFGQFIGHSVLSFVKKNGFNSEFIASHGHTVFHQPDIGLTIQIGSGAEIAAKSGLKTICDFRTSDVAFGGQGAPLVPIGDELLFGKYSACLNLGGFANISFQDFNERMAFDICPVNIVLNHLANTFGKPYDKSGELGRTGAIDDELLNALNNISFYSKPGAKSLGREFVEQQIFPLFNNSKSNVDILRTFYEHIAIQLSIQIINLGCKEILVTGGGTYNSFLLELLNKKINGRRLIIPDNKTIDYKEALIFAFLGMLRFYEQKNCLKSVTGANVDSVGGCIYC